MKAYLAVIFLPDVCITAFKISLVVGTILALINHYPAIVNDSLTAQNFWQIVLTYLVPYGVSSYSSAKIMLKKQG